MSAPLLETRMPMHASSQALECVVYDSKLTSHDGCRLCHLKIVYDALQGYKIALSKPVARPQTRRELSFYGIRRLK